MGFWPFGGGKRHRKQDSHGHEREKSKQIQSTPTDPIIRSEKGDTQRNVSGSQQSGQVEREQKSRRLSRNRTSMPAFGTTHGQQIPRSTTAPLVSSKKQSPTAPKYEEKDMYQHTPISQSSIGPENFQVLGHPPTLYARRPERDSGLSRPKSSKRKAEDYAREREVQALSSSPIPIPKRTSTLYGSEVMERDTQDVPGDLNKKLKRPTSRVSLPTPQALPGLDEVSNEGSFRIGTFAALSPRPSLRYDLNPRNASGKQVLKSKPSLRQAIVEEGNIREEDRINELADDLDAGGVRELLEKDRRRREKKKEADRAKLQRKLQRRAERQKEEEEARKARTEDYVRQSSLHREDGADFESSSPSKKTSKKREEAGPSSPKGKLAVDPFQDPVKDAPQTGGVIRNPFEDEKDMDVMQDQPDYEDEAEPDIPIKSPLRATAEEGGKQGTSTPTALSPPTSPIHRPTDGGSVSQASYLNREESQEAPATSSIGRRPSDQSSQRLSSWTNFFRRGTRRQPSTSFRGRDTPSEFSNTSRESFAHKQQPPPVVIPTARTFRRSDSGAPQRTMSKFREDLPELPISPPDSRVQSPETAGPANPSGISQGLKNEGDRSTGEVGAGERALTPSSPIAGRVGRIDPPSMDNDAANVGGPIQPVAQSLASVDSEGSWLSGRPINRQSVQGSHKPRKSESSLRRQMPGSYDNDNEGVADDEFMSRLSPAPGEERPSLENEDRKPSSTVLNLEEDKTHLPSANEARISPAEETYRSGIARQPTVVRQAGRARSKEGLLQEYSADETKTSEADTEGEGEGELETPGGEFPEAQLMRATSVTYKGHARQISAGSAKLLDIRRGSIQSEAIQSETGSRSKMSPPLDPRKSAASVAQSSFSALDPRGSATSFQPESSQTRG